MTVPVTTMPTFVIMLYVMMKVFQMQSNLGQWSWVLVPMTTHLRSTMWEPARTAIRRVQTVR
jgi:hypothetical protein